MSSTQHFRRIRIWLAVFIAGLVLRGITAFPLESEVRLLFASCLRSAAPNLGRAPTQRDPLVPASYRFGRRLKCNLIPHRAKSVRSSAAP